MGAGELVSGIVGLLGLLFHFFVVAGLTFWAHRVATRRGGAYRLAQVLPLLALLSTCLGVGVTAVSMMRAFNAVADAAAYERASLLAEDISMAMNATLCGLVLTVLLYLASVGVSAFGTWGPRADR